jgi:ABC-type branched-subunit amino acid transport system substrate-binding protein
VVGPGAIHDKGESTVRKSFRLAAGVVALGLVAAACSEDNGTSSGTTAGEAATTAAPATTTATSAATGSSEAPTTTGSSNADRDKVALDYVGATEAKAASGDPITIGYVNQEGGVPAFPEATVGLEAAVDYINSTLGGVQGRPVQIKKCVVQKEEDGQKCGQEMLADDSVKFVLTGVLANGNQPLYDTLAGQKPVIIGNPLTTPDFLAKDAYAFTPGAPGVVQGLVKFITQMLPGGKPAKAAVVYADNPGGQASFNAFTKPLLEKAGVAVTGVPIADTAGPQDFAPAIQAAGAQDAGVFIPLVTIQGCIGTYDALKQLGITTPVVTTGLCYGTAMRDHLKQTGASGEFPEWYYGGYGYSYFIPGQPELDNYLSVVQDYAKAKGIQDIEYTGFAGPMYGNALTLVKFMNQIGPDNVSPDTIRQASQAFTGPMWGVVGPMACGKNPTFPPLCGIQMGIQQYKDGQWISIADGLNGMPIDPSQP